MGYFRVQGPVDRGGVLRVTPSSYLHQGGVERLRPQGHGRTWDPGRGVVRGVSRMFVFPPSRYPTGTRDESKSESWNQTKILSS